MPIPLYLAMTSAEFHRCASLPKKMAWMACHFSSYGTGLSNRPAALPEGSLLILNDRIPVSGHDPQQVAEELSALATELHCEGILLDFQHPNEPITEEIVGAICQSVPCPVAVSESYCFAGNCAVFLSAPPLHKALSEHLLSWKDREIWLEAALEESEMVITETGCRTSPLTAHPDIYPHSDSAAFCHYHIAAEMDQIRFSLRRSREDWETIQAKAENIRCLVGLYQQFR